MLFNDRVTPAGSALLLLVFDSRVVVVDAVIVVAVEVNVVVVAVIIVDVIVVLDVDDRRYSLSGGVRRRIQIRVAGQQLPLPRNLLPRHASSPHLQGPVSSFLRGDV